MKRFKVDSESGNVLFLILIAVVLFAALSYAVTSSTNSSGGNVDEEALQLEASRLIGWAASAQASFQRRSLVHGLGAEDWGFNYTGSGTLYNCSRAVDGQLCQFYSKYTNTRYNEQGLGFARIPIEDGLFVLSNSSAAYLANTVAQTNIKLMRIKDLGLDNNAELVLEFLGLTQEFCEAINKELQIDMPLPFASGVTISSPYDATFSEPSGVFIAGETETSLAGKQMFCNNQVGYFGGSIYQFYIVLLPR